MKIGKKHICICMGILLTFLYINTHIIWAADADEPIKVIMLIINRVDFDELYSMPVLGSIIDNSSIGLMNTRGSGGNNEFKSYATLGWGTRADAAKNTSTFQQLNVENGAIYSRRTGSISKQEGIVNLDINRLLKQNKIGEYGASPGILGDLLRKNNYKTILLGNSDIEDSLSRAAGLIPMDSKGYIDYGNVTENLLVKDPLSPFGIRTNYDKLIKDFAKIYDKGDFIVIETGDTNRLEKYKDNLNDEMYNIQKENILQNIDGFVDELIKHIDTKNSTLMIVTPYPSDYSIANGNRLTPIIIYDGGQNTGLLYSSTTRRTGVIGNVDVGPTVLSYFGINPVNMTGRELTNVEMDNTINEVQYLNNRIVNTSTQRYRILYSFAIYQMVISFIVLLMIIFRKNVSHKLYKKATLLLISTIIIPFVLLVLPIFGMLGIIYNYLLLISITSLLVFGLYYLSGKTPLNIMIYGNLLVAGGIIIDIILGQPLMKNSLLGYDPIIGARYYGIGNEYMGVLIGSVLIFTTALVEKYNINKKFIIFLYILTTLAIALPTLGANVGGTITAVFTFLFVSIRLSKKRISFKTITGIFFVILFVVALMAVIDLFFMEDKSHLAIAIEEIISKGPIVAYQIITRKIAMNLRLMGVTVWSKVLISTIIILGILFYRPIGIVRKIIDLYPSIAIGWSGIIIACMVSFAVNDSGVVSAATTIIFLNTSILYLIMENLDTPVGL